MSEIQTAELWQRTRCHIRIQYVMIKFNDIEVQYCCHVVSNTVLSVRSHELVALELGRGRPLLRVPREARQKQRVELRVQRGFVHRRRGLGFVYL